MLFYIFILIALFGIYKIALEIAEQRTCPNDNDLREVVLGITKKNTKIAENVIRHLGICEKCQDRAREIGEEL